MEIVLGPPGTGKTTRLLRIVDEEIARGVPSERIAYVSFTRRAADEAAGRACEKFNLSREQLPWFRTLHSLCFRWLGLKSAEVLEGSRMQEFAKFAGITITGRWTEDGTLSGFEEGDRIMFMENLARVRGITVREQYDQDSDGLPWVRVKFVSEALREFKQKTGYVDYSDMLHDFVDHGAELRLRTLIVDEAQDNSMLQWRVVEQLSRGCERVAVAGDDDQAIYRWAGAAVDHFVDLAGDVDVLGQSYRVPRRVQNIANRVISRVKHRRPKAWDPRAVDGEEIRVPAIQRADVSGQDVLILARNVYVVRDQIEPYLRSLGIIYDRGGHSSVSAKMLAAIDDWERLRRGDSITASDARIVYDQLSSGRGVARGFKKKLKGLDDDAKVGLGDLRSNFGLQVETAWFDALDRLPTKDVSYVRLALSRGEKLRGPPRVRVSTIHGAKGGEAEHVVLMTEMARRTFREAEYAPEDEARVWYVGVTRAKERLTIVGAQTQQFYRI